MIRATAERMLAWAEDTDSAIEAFGRTLLVVYAFGAVACSPFFIAMVLDAVL